MIAKNCLQIKAIILCAGKALPEFGKKPKCLHHIQGKSRLLGIFESFEKAGIKNDEILLVLGNNNIGNEYIKEFLTERDFRPNIVFNKQSNKSAVYTFRTAFQKLQNNLHPVIITLGDEYYHPSILQEIIAEKRDLVCFARPQKENRKSPPALNIFKISPQLIPYFIKDIYLSLDFYTPEQSVFQEYFNYEKSDVPLSLWGNISSGINLGFMQLHAIDAVATEFPECYALLSDHGLYIADLDSITQTDAFKQTSPFIRPFIYFMFFYKKTITRVRYRLKNQPYLQSFFTMFHGVH